MERSINIKIWKPEDARVPIKSWCPDPEQGAVDQINQAARLPFVFRHVAMMPDGHAGYGVPVGTVFASEGVVVPYFVGVDIGCGMVAAQTSLTEISTDQLKAIMGEIRKVIPLGSNHQKENQEWPGFDDAPDLEVIQRELASARKQLGTLGGGNHFIEIQMGDDGHVWVMIHSGSRNFGLRVAGEYHKKALAMMQRWHSNVPDKDLAFLPLDTQEGLDYIAAMSFCLDFAKENRHLMLLRLRDIVEGGTGCDFIGPAIDVHHNYAALEHHFGRNVLVHRKGAIRARAGETGVIPGSMGTASYITVGLGNPDSFMSSSHGAGRRMGRKEAMRSLNLEEEQAKMAGILGAPRGKDDLDEAPGAYKSIEDVMANQQDLVKTKVTLWPLASVKG